MGRRSHRERGIPTLSVLLAVHDGMPFLPGVLDSILGQSHPATEIVVVDDSSEDGTAAYLAGVKDHRLVVVRVQARNQAKALNAGLAVCTGEWIARFDADDPAHRDRFRRFVEQGDRLAPFGVVSTRTVTIFGDAAEVAWPANPGSGRLEDVTARMALRNPIAHSAAFVRRSAFAAIGGYDETQDIMNDYLTWVRIAEAGWRIGLLDEVLAAVRVHGAQHFARLPRLRYVTASCRVQWRAARRVNSYGPVRSAALVSARLGYGLLLPYNARARVRRWLDERRR